MKNKKLKELLNQYPDECYIKLMYNGVILNINGMSIEYYEADEYTIPEIIIDGSC